MITSGDICLPHVLIGIANSYISDIEITYADGEVKSFNNNEYDDKTFVNAESIHVNNVFKMPNGFRVGNIKTITGHVICPTESVGMFDNSRFNGDISEWDVSGVTGMGFMFSNSQFNGDISKWDVSGVTDMGFMFSNSPFNGDISKWDVSGVTDMSFMFSNSPFTGDISKWDVSTIADTSFMFSNPQFNGDISKWDVSSVTDMDFMFRDPQFNGNIAG